MPPLPLWYFGILVIPILACQILVWKRFALFHGGWYRDLVVAALFMSEFVLLFFVTSLISWPIYFAAYFFFYFAKI